jgi:IS1 family transposase
MPGRKITKQQVNLYMTSRINGYTQVTSSAKAGISERSGKRIESNNCLILSPTARNWTDIPHQIASKNIFCQRP